MKKLFEKSLAIIMAVVLAITVVPLSGFVGLELPDWLGFKASAATNSGTCGKNLTWTFNESTGELVFAGTGNMTNYSSSSAVPWDKFLVKSISFPNGLTSIGDYAFFNLTNINMIRIPYTVKSIGLDAFNSCAVKEVYIPNGVETIGAGAFRYCVKLEKIFIGNTVNSIKRLAFDYCYNLRDVYYYGSEADWEKISIGSSNDDLISATIHYNHSPLSNIVTNSSVGDIVEFGSYPQSKVADAALISALDSVSKIWVSYGYYSGTNYYGDGKMQSGDWMKYSDITYGGERYRAVVFNKYRPYHTHYTNSDTNSNQDENGYKIDNIYYFRYEPLLWYVLDPQEGLLLSKNLIDSQAFNNTTYYNGNDSFQNVFTITYSNNYAESSIREWLNNDFYNIAFSSNEKSAIRESVCENVAYNSIYDTISTKDKIFLLSYRDIQNDEYKFLTSDSPYYANTTEYAKCQGGDDFEDAAQWWLRTSYDSSDTSCIVIDPGYVCGYLVDGCMGIRPALKINIESENIKPETQYGINISEDIVFIDKDEHYLFSAYDKNGNDITDKVDWSSTTSVDCTGEVMITNKGDVLGVKQGLTNLHASYWDKETLENLGDDSCYVFVGEPNEVKYTSVSDQIYYYGENAFYSDAGQFSNSVDIYIALENAMHEQIEFLTEYDEYADEFEKLAIEGYTLYASVSGSNLSFYKDEYSNNYIATVDRNIPINKALDNLLTLYPHNLDVSSGDKNFTVTIKIESESFETITDSFTFKISSLEDKEINEHISFIDGNGSGSMYKAMRDNDFATGMSDLKNDSQYIWSKYSTLDFENYHEILMADILVKLMETQLVGHISLLPVLKEWNSNYNTILSSVSTIVEDSYAGSMEITDNLIDEVIKKSKYTTEGMDVHDEVRDLVVLKLRDKVSIDKINSAFAALDKTGQCIDLFDMGVNITNDIADWVDCVSIMNSYQNMNEEFKNVIKKVYDCIPNDDWKVKEAVNHYVKLDTTAGYTQEVIESVIELSKDITLEVFNSVFKKQFVSMFTKAVGEITLKSGALLSSTTAFSAISTGLGAISTGATLGLCISDILCNNSGQAAEMGRVVAASQLAPYVIQTLKYYEWALKNYKDESSLKHFEVAFNLNKALQIYSIEHTYKGLEIQANSIVIKLFSRRDYPGAMAELASLKTSHINCNCCEDVYTGVIKTKTIAIKCPVDVYIYDENGKEVVRIINDVVVSVEDGINVFINGREKYVTVPANQEYSVKIVATDEGTMDYLVIEHDETGQYDRIVKSLNIDLNKNQTFTGKVCEEFDVNKDSYALNTNGAVIKPNSSANVSTEIADKIPVLSIYEASKTGNTLTVNIDLTKNEFNSFDLIFVLNGLKCKKIEAGNSLKALEVEQYSLNPNAIGTQANLSCSTNNGIKPGTVVKITFEIVEDEYRFTAKSLACGIVVNGKIIETEPIINDIVSGAIHKHFYTTKVTQPTCTEQGFTTYSCSCGDSYISDYTSETGHADGKWQIFMVSSEDGIILENSTCPVCGSSLGLNFIEDFISINKIEMNYMNSSTLTTSINSAPGNGYTISYSSSNPTIAAVDANGKITAKGIGSATITITVTDELGNTTTDTCDVNVQYTWWQWIIVIILFGWLWY